MNDPNKVPLIERECRCGCGRKFKCMPQSQSVYFCQECKLMAGVYDRTYFGKLRQGRKGYNDKHQ